MSVALPGNVVRGAFAAALIAMGLAGCSSASEKMAEAMSGMPGIGLPANAPERPAEQRAYPAVHDMPPPRSSAVLTAEEQRAIEKELVSAREGQKASAQRPR